jgi:hypothetical protein
MHFASFLKNTLFFSPSRRTFWTIDLYSEFPSINITSLMVVAMSVFKLKLQNHLLQQRDVNVVVHDEDDCHPN